MLRFASFAHFAGHTNSPDAEAPSVNLLLKPIGLFAALAAVTVSRPAIAEDADQVNDRPLNLKVVPAFPNIKWPADATGVGEGLIQDVRPIIITGAGDGTNRIFVATQPGMIYVFPNDPAADEIRLFIDLRDRIHYRVPQENEEGFLGLAFHPKFKENGEFFVYYTSAYNNEADRHSVISRFRVSNDDPSRADPASEEIILTIPQPYWNHNGGTIVFGPDGYLYVGLGDGGSGGDPHGNGQNLSTLLGSILRIDVDRRDPGLNYAIPQDNPFVGRSGARPEIWAYGIRNVWRIAFDRQTGVLWAGDVGQDTWEEIDIITRGGNYGWNLREGMHPFGDRGSDPRPDLIEPIWEYHHDVGKSITGGNVYRGQAVPELNGAYLYADWVGGQVWALWYDFDAQRVTANRPVVKKGAPVMTFGEDDAGELYYATQEGGLWKFEP
ncbi:MAG: PQQ-dependent sugar dehydrogenase [Pirellulales bacterium]|nr:PQQ-dependent sugar dehydrogenase [Pirellulales bacterium]